MLYAFILTITGQAQLVGPLPSFDSCKAVMYERAKPYADAGVGIVATCLPEAETAVRLLDCVIDARMRPADDKPGAILARCRAPM